MVTSHETPDLPNIRPHRQFSIIWKRIAMIAGISFMAGAILFFMLIFTVSPDDWVTETCKPSPPGEIRPCEAVYSPKELTPLEKAVGYYMVFSLFFSPVLTLPWFYQYRERWVFKILGIIVVLWSLVGLSIIIVGLLDLADL